MLRLLLDEQMDPAVVAHMRDQYPNILIDSLHTWEDRRYLRTSDAKILAEAYRQSLTLVTYDTRTVVPLLKTWGESGTPHGGVIFVKPATIAQDNIGGLMRALVQLWEQYGADDWTNVTTYLTP